MKYSVLGKTGLKVSRLGFGAMRLPMDGQKVDRRLAVPILQKAVELGINYFDTAVMYCDGDSQKVLGETFQAVRKQIIFSTKNPFYQKNQPREWWRNLNESLEFLKTDYIDIYNFHGINWSAFEKEVSGDDGLYAQMLKAKAQGLIRHICFSFHDTPENLIKLVDTELFDSVTLQDNLLDRSNEQAIFHAAKKGMGVVVMGPVGGGRLGLKSEAIAEISGGLSSSTPELALKFVLGHPGVTVALSGMSTMEQLLDNVRIVEMTTFLTPEQIKKVEKVVEERKLKQGIYCPACGYCQPCPAGVDIPGNFNAYNLEKIYGLTEHAKDVYRTLFRSAVFCNACGSCLKKCPQKINIPEKLKETVKILDDRADFIRLDYSFDGIEATGIRIKAEVRNLSEERADLELFWSSSSDTKGRIKLGGLDSFKRVFKYLTVPAKVPGEIINLHTLIRSNGKGMEEDKQLEYLLSEFCAGYILDPAREVKGLVCVDMEKNLTSGNREALLNHGFGFKLFHDEDNLYVYIDAKDDFLFPIAPVKVFRPVDCFELFLDGREKAKLGKPAYEEGVLQAFFYPGNPPDIPAHFIFPKGEGVQAKSARTDDGYRLDIAIPFNCFCNGRKPEIIGFDLAMNSADSDGKQLFQVTFSGKPWAFQNASVFKTVILTVDS